MDTETVYVTRDENSDWVFVWRKPSKGSTWEPQNVNKKDNFVNWQRSDRSLDGVTIYLSHGFRKKFGIAIHEKEKKHIALPVSLLNSDDYQLINSNKERKQDDSDSES